MIPGKPVKRRVIVSIDGFNLYFGIRDSGLGKYLWLDLCAFSKSLLKDGQELAAVKYFTSRVSAPESKRKRQLAYLDALKTLDPALLSIQYGNFQVAPFTCHQCGKDPSVSNEKKTDVNIAVSMLTDAYRSECDVALLVSADSDLCPAVEAVRVVSPDTTVIACFPPGRASKELAASAHGCYPIGKGKLSQSQFPGVVRTSSGFELRKPAWWDDPSYPG